MRLPARLDTLGALAFAGQLRALLAEGAPVRLDASGVEAIGIVALQLLAAARATGPLALEDVPPAIAEQVEDAGLAGALLDGAPTSRPGRRLRVRFDEAALRFGGEPLALLGALRAAGAGIEAVLPAEQARVILAEPDRLAIAFDVWPDDPAAAEALLAGEPGAHFAWSEGAAEDLSVPAPAPPPSREEAPPLVPVAQAKLDEVVTLADALVSANATLVGRLGPHRAHVSSEIADVERTAALLQDGIVRLGTSRLDDLVAQALPGGAPALLAGGAIEIERALFARIAPAFVGALAGATLAAREEGGFLALRIAWEGAAPAWEPLAEAAQRLGGWAVAREGGRMLDLRLPRSLTLFEVLVLEVGEAAYAMPVSYMVEALRPAADILARIGGRTVLRYREQYVPVAAIGARFALDRWERDPARAVLVVVRVGEALAALQADAISDQRQVALKPLGGGLALPPGLAGAAVIGADRIALVLDMAAFGAEPPALRAS